LETNRGETSHFAIEGIKYDQKKTPFPKAYTCFNRLILPIYPNETLMMEGLMAIVRNNLDGVWGME
jgi:E3 ubiquitin-protein ligase HUWE1